MPRGAAFFATIAAATAPVGRADPPDGGNLVAAGRNGHAATWDGTAPFVVQRVPRPRARGIFPLARKVSG